MRGSWWNRMRSCPSFGGERICICSFMIKTVIIYLGNIPPPSPFSSLPFHQEKLPHHPFPPSPFIAPIIPLIYNKITNMSLRRHRTESTQIQRQRSVRSIQNQHFFQIQRKKYKPASGNIYSLHSIDTKRSSINLYNNGNRGTHRRRQLSIPLNEPKHLLTERPEARVGVGRRGERASTIEGERLEEKEKRIENCIQLMCGVLKEIKNEKETKRVSKPKIIDEFPHTGQEHRKAEETPQSKFQSYVKNITKLKDSNKLILIKRGKSKSIINNENIHSSNTSNGKSFLKDRVVGGEAIPKKSVATVLPQARPATKLQEISCSSIEKGNQSSFVSELSRQSFMKQLMEEGRSEEKELETRRVTRFKNSKQLKQMFPVDFF